MAQLVVPGTTPCLRCLHRELPRSGTVKTCDMVGIIGPAAALASALQASIALRFLVEGAAPAAILYCADAWSLELERVPLPPRDVACPCCAEGRFEYLESPTRTVTALCGRDAVQVRPLAPGRPDLAALATRLRAIGTVHLDPLLLRLRAPPYELTVFDDGRVIVKGTSDEALARSLVSRWIGV
jgi:adenylyltransferase/sulfurtransferase